MTADIERPAPIGGLRIGAWLTLGEPHVAEMTSRVGFDIVVIDRQHGLINDGRLCDMLRAVKSGGRAKAFVRCESAAAAHVGRMLDIGADGLIVPMIDNALEVETLASSLQYAPSGKRSFGPSRVGLFHDDYYRDGADAFELWPMIETAGALDDVERIVGTRGVSGVFVGPADLSLSLGLTPARDHDDGRFRAAINRILAAAAAAKKTAGIQADDSVSAKRIGERFSFVTVCLDSSDLRKSFQSSLKRARDAAAVG